VKIPQKTRSLIIIFVFLAILLLPVCYALYNENIMKHAESKKGAAGTENTVKPVDK